MEEKVLVCHRVGDLFKSINPESLISKCDDCKKDIYIMPDNLVMATVTLCYQCATPNFSSGEFYIKGEDGEWRKFND